MLLRPRAGPRLSSVHAPLDVPLDTGCVGCTFSDLEGDSGLVEIFPSFSFGLGRALTGRLLHPRTGLGIRAVSCTSRGVGFVERRRCRLLGAAEALTAEMSARGEAETGVDGGEEIRAG